MIDHHKILNHNYSGGVVMIKISICDDEILFCKTLETLLIEYCNSHNITADIKIFDSSIHFLDNYTTDTDILFLDIRMPLQDGLSVAQEIRKKDSNVFLIFTTSLRQYVFKGYDYQAYQYLLKPISARRIALLMDNLLPKLKHENQKSLMVKIKGNMHKICLSDLSYIETQSRKALLHIDNKQIFVNKKMQEFEKLLPTHSFFRCQSGYIVNLSYIKDIIGYQIYLTTGAIIPLSKQKKPELMQQLAIYWGGEVL